MTIDITVFEDEVKRHMEDQPYHISCAECGGDLIADSEIDKDLDITLNVWPCKACQEEVVK